jgi:hypothetical protein
LKRTSIDEEPKPWEENTAEVATPPRDPAEEEALAAEKAAAEAVAAEKAEALAAAKAAKAEADAAAKAARLEAEAQKRAARAEAAAAEERAQADTLKATAAAAAAAERRAQAEAEAAQAQAQALPDAPYVDIAEAPAASGFEDADDDQEFSALEAEEAANTRRGTATDTGYLVHGEQDIADDDSDDEQEFADGPPAPDAALCTFEFEAEDDSELSMQEGDRIVNITMVSDDWWTGLNERTNETGTFPSNHVEEEY